MPLPGILEREQKATENGDDSPENQMITSDQYLRLSPSEINISTPHLDPTINSIVLLRRSIQTLGTETCMINEDASEEGPSTSQVSLRHPVYKKRLLQTEDVNLGDNRPTEYVIKCSPSGNPGLDTVLLIVAVRDCHFVSQ
ncbi:hypothetical protein DUI87_07667 [Hirundo rustica rustica]|uniref:Uncharacterized protein n=1 Tax=Hirundo rustica rustica TaxID=333673 RepID=A0A3M0KQN5_HIRRU|nr:hypothetical protein DUI87_07667 [Hirundo rustica rustica]